MKSWYVQYGCELGSEHCVILCEEEERVKEWAIDQSHFHYSGYTHGEFENEFEEQQWEDDNRFWLVEPFSPYDDMHMEAYDNEEIIEL